VGQTILLSSNVQTTISLQIISIEEINSSTYLITVGGDVDISGYTTVDNAQIKAFLPNTINSTCQIYVPYNAAPDNTTDSPPIPALSSVELVGLSKVDWLLTSDYDVAIDTHGDTVMSAGITNLIQALTLILLTPKGTVIKAPQSGGAIQPGGSVADTSAAALFKQIQQSILADGRFNGIQNLQITVAPPVIQIYLEVSYSQGIVLPISFSVPAPAGATSGN
jgi:hypothetical protein